MTRRNKFGIDLGADIEAASARRDRKPGPMGTAIRDTAENLQAATEEKVEQRRRNAADADRFREAVGAGRLLVSIPLDDVRTDDLPRDRMELEAIAASDEMDELKASIRERGQRDPIEVYQDAEGAYHLMSGWRRLNALRQLRDETGDDAFSSVTAKLAGPDDDRLTRYLDMAEENIIREDLTFAEMAQLAITAAEDPAIDESDADAVVGRLYRSVHKVKRSYIRSFVLLLQSLGDDLRFPKAVSRNIGVDIARLMKANPDVVEPLRASLRDVSTPDEQSAVLQRVLDAKPAPTVKRATSPGKKKFEFHLEGSKVTARRGELRIMSGVDFTEVPKDRLERAVMAFKKALEE